MNEIASGANAAVGSIKEAIGASRNVTSLVRDIDNEATSIAQERAAQRRKEQQVQPDLAVLKAYNEYQLLAKMQKVENDLKAEIIKHHGPKAWQDVQAIKQKIIKQEMENEKLFRQDVTKGRITMICCWIVMGWISWYLTWGIK